jgi:phenylacetate-CoA ligase
VGGEAGLKRWYRESVSPSGFGEVVHPQEVNRPVVDPPYHLTEGEKSLSIDFRVRDFAYPVGILHLRRFLERSQWLSREELEGYQEERLRRIIHHAYEHVPYYREMLDRERLKPQDIQALEDLSKLPLLTRDGVRERFNDLCADNARHFRPAEAFTTGTTGTPLKFLLDKPANTLEFAYYWRFWSWGGYRLGNRFADLRYDYFMRGPETVKKAWQLQPTLRRLLLNSMQISRERIADYAAALRRYRPRFIRGRPTNLYCLALLLREKGLDDIEFQAVFTGGEIVAPEIRKMIESTFGCKVLDSYSHMERCMAVSQCLEGNYHIHMEYGVLELANGEHQDDAVTTGRVVCTSLHKMAMPFVRYSIEDVLELFGEEKQCPCGRTLPLVKAIHGRYRPVMATAEGRPITTLAPAFRNLKGIRAFQFIFEEPGRITVRIVKGNGYTLGTEEGLKLGLKNCAGEETRFDLEYVSESELERDETGMLQMVISHVKPEDTLKLL